MGQMEEWFDSDECKPFPEDSKIGFNFWQNTELERGSRDTIKDHDDIKTLKRKASEESEEEEEGEDDDEHGD